MWTGTFRSRLSGSRRIQWLLTLGTKSRIATASSGTQRQLACRQLSRCATKPIRHIFSRSARPLLIKHQQRKPKLRILWLSSTRRITRWRLIPSWTRWISMSCGGVRTLKVGYGSILPPSRSCSSRIGMEVLRSTMPCISRREVCEKTLEWVITISRCLNAW